jgi:hypothetical protein
MSISESSSPRSGVSIKLNKLRNKKKNNRGESTFKKQFQRSRFYRDEDDEEDD